MLITEHPGIDTLREELADIERKVMTYSLADAIREGSTVTSQMVRGFYNPQGEACALAAARIAVEARHLA